MAVIRVSNRSSWIPLLGILSLFRLAVAIPSNRTTQNGTYAPILPCHQQQQSTAPSTCSISSPMNTSLPLGMDFHPTLVIDTFNQISHNDLGYWHGAGEDLPVEYGIGYVRFSPSDPDHNYHTQLASEECFSLLPYQDQYLHVEFSGTTKFSISLNQNNEECDAHRRPYPETWDSVEATRYALGSHHIFVPLSHFYIDKSKVLSVSFNGFYTRETLKLHRVEIVAEVPTGYPLPDKLDSGRMVLKCTRPNSFAFGIDDGQPQFAQQVMDILEKEGVLVTFFVVGTGLRSQDTNFTEVYREMLRRGHQIALHSDTHRKMEGLEAIEDIDDEIIKNIETFQGLLGVESRYFRPPFGTVGARLRQRLALQIVDPQIVNWSVDIEDWLWAGTDTPEKQLEAFYRDVRLGGNLAVMHYLSPSTIQYFPKVIQFVKARNATIMRIDQCLEDPASPPLTG